MIKKNTLPADVMQHCSSSHLNSAEKYNFSTINSLLHAHAEEDSDTSNSHHYFIS
jgi:hypothetical protein